MDYVFIFTLILCGTLLVLHFKEANKSREARSELVKEKELNGEKVKDLDQQISNLKAELEQEKQTGSTCQKGLEEEKKKTATCQQGLEEEKKKGSSCPKELEEEKKKVSTCQQEKEKAMSDLSNRQQKKTEPTNATAQAQAGAKDGQKAAK